MSILDTTTQVGRQYVYRLGDALISAGVLIEPREVLDFAERPHKWRPESDAWIALSRPAPGDPAWDAFTKKLEELE